MEPSKAVSELPPELEPAEVEPVDIADSEGLPVAEVIVDDCDVTVAIGMTAVLVSCWTTTEEPDGWIDAAVEAEVAIVVGEVWTGVPVDATGAADDAFAEPVPSIDCEPSAAPLPKPVGRLYVQPVCTVAS